MNSPKRTEKYVKTGTTNLRGRVESVGDVADGPNSKPPVRSTFPKGENERKRETTNYFRCQRDCRQTRGWILLMEKLLKNGFFVLWLKSNSIKKNTLIHCEHLIFLKMFSFCLFPFFFFFFKSLSLCCRRTCRCWTTHFLRDCERLCNRSELSGRDTWGWTGNFFASRNRQEREEFPSLTSSPFSLPLSRPDPSTPPAAALAADGGEAGGPERADLPPLPGGGQERRWRSVVRGLPVSHAQGDPPASKLGAEGPLVLLPPQPIWLLPLGSSRCLLPPLPL